MDAKMRFIQAWQSLPEFGINYYIVRYSAVYTCVSIHIYILLHLNDNLRDYSFLCDSDSEAVRRMSFWGSRTTVWFVLTCPLAFLSPRGGSPTWSSGMSTGRLDRWAIVSPDSAVSRLLHTDRIISETWIPYLLHVIPGDHRVWPECDNSLLLSELRLQGGARVHRRIHLPVHTRQRPERVTGWRPVP